MSHPRLGSDPPYWVGSGMGCDSIDGTHLYGKYKGTLLIAMGCDGNNQLFPLAFAITEGENIDSWG